MFEYLGDKKMKIEIIAFLFMIILVVTGCKNDNEGEDNGTELQITWDNLAKKIDENPDSQASINQIFSRDLRTNPPSSTSEALQELYQLINDPNLNPSASKNALELFVKVNAKDVIRESLLNRNHEIPGWDMIIIASESVASTKDEKALPNLISVLAKNNYPQPGSESATIHQRMKRELIEAIKSITKLDIDIDKLNINDPKQIENILSQARDWAKKHNIPLNENK